jgi:hypothetical protein
MLSAGAGFKYPINKVQTLHMQSIFDQLELTDVN